ncbi:MAG TPA: TetR family transcriptional regulator [Candidatus Krumholzibacteria bacterium]|nr:TetR family transcriptional regulator [Candidatus Krumholzibacteria bacterium]
MKRPLRSQATRDRILDAATRLFADVGYDRTTIRAVAAEARIHPSMVMRYYGSKEGLFAAVATFDLEIPDLTQAPKGEAGRTLVRHFLRRWKAHAEELPALLRVAVTHDQARAQLLALFRDQVAPAVAKVCGAERAGVCAGLVVTQMIGLAMTRQVLRVPVVVDLPEELLIDRVGATIENYIAGPDTAG